MIGGGQLARMTHQAAIPLGQSLRVLAVSENDPAALVARDVVLGHGDPSVGTPVFALRPGQPGVAVSELRPGGVCEFGDQRVPSQSEAGIIRAGTPVRVVAYADGRATVRAV